MVVEENNLSSCLGKVNGQALSIDCGLTLMCTVESTEYSTCYLYFQVLSWGLSTRLYVLLLDYYLGSGYWLPL
jgi:hypothetical protein